MKIKEPGSNTLYAGNGEIVSDFTVNISKSGVYSIILCLWIHCNLYGICSKSGNRHQRTVWKHRAILLKNSSQNEMDASRKIQRSIHDEKLMIQFI